MGVGPCGDELNNIQIEMSGRNFGEFFKVGPDALDVNFKFGSQISDSDFISDIGLASQTTAIINFIIAMIESGFIDPVRIFGHYQLSFAGSPDPGAQYLGYVQARVITDLYSRGRITQELFNKYWYELSYGGLQQLRVGSGRSSAEYFEWYVGRLVGR